MKIVLTLMFIAGYGGLAAAQEAIPTEQLQKAAAQLAKSTADQPNPPFQTVSDTSKAVGMKIREYAVVVLPAKSLTKESLDEVSQDVMPIGHLWLKQLTPVADGKKVANEKLRTLRISLEKKEQTLQLLFIGARKRPDASLELVVFGTDSDPISTLPLKKAENRQDLPVELGMRKESTSFGIIDVHLPGQFEASLTVDEFYP